MKTLKSVLLIFVVSCIAAGMAYAESPKIVDGGSLSFTDFPLCNGDEISGDIYYEYMEINSKVQIKYWGSMTGTTGNVYTIKQISNWNVHSDKIFTEIVNFKARLDGKLVELFHATIHTTVVDGEIVVDIFRVSSHCK